MLSDDIFAALERDALATAGSAFTALAADYLDRTRGYGHWAACGPVDGRPCGAGAGGRRHLVIVAGEHCHYAATRAAGELGLGTRNVVLVPTRQHQMEVEALRETLDALVAAGRTAIAVVATAGTTPTGSFDDLDAIGCSATIAGSGSTWTERTAPRRFAPRAIGTGSAESSGRTRSDGIRTR